MIEADAVDPLPPALLFSAFCFPLEEPPLPPARMAPDPSRRNKISQKSFSEAPPPLPPPPVFEDDEGREPAPTPVEDAASVPLPSARPGELRAAPRGSSLSEALLFIAAGPAFAADDDDASSSSFLPPGRKCVGKLFASEINVSAKGESQVFL